MTGIPCCCGSRCCYGENEDLILVEIGECQQSFCDKGIEEEIKYLKKKIKKMKNNLNNLREAQKDGKKVNINDMKKFYCTKCRVCHPENTDFIERHKEYMVKKIMYWYDDYNPKDFIGKEIDKEKKEKAISILKNGKSGCRYQYRGYSKCRVCGEELGSSDCFGLGFMWPYKTEHYIEKHDLWIDELNELIIKSEGV